MAGLKRREILMGAGALLSSSLAAPAVRAQSTAWPFYDDDVYDTRRRPRGGADMYDPYAGSDPYRGVRRDPRASDDLSVGSDLYGSRPAPSPGPNGQRPSSETRQGFNGRPVSSVDYVRAYAGVREEPFPIAAFDYKRMNPAFLRQPVAYTGSEPPGTIIINPRDHHLLYVEQGGRAMRYGVGVGRQGFAWNGVATINSKQEWPDWYPPKEMLDRDKGLAKQMSQLQSGIGMHGGPRNPLGARALYLWQNNKDTLYRIHGTVEPYTIGQSVSSGCIRMINQDVLDLYARTAVGARVVVLG